MKPAKNTYCSVVQTRKEFTPFVLCWPGKPAFLGTVLFLTQPVHIAFESFVTLILSPTKALTLWENDFKTKYMFNHCKRMLFFFLIKNYENNNSGNDNDN